MLGEKERVGAPGMRIGVAGAGRAREEEVGGGGVEAARRRSAWVETEGDGRE